MWRLTPELSRTDLRRGGVVHVTAQAEPRSGLGLNELLGAITGGGLCRGYRDQEEDQQRRYCIWNGVKDYKSQKASERANLASELKIVWDQERPGCVCRNQR